MNRFQTLSLTAIFAVFATCLPFLAAAQSFISGLEKLEAGQASEAVAIWTKLAENGDVESQYGLALVYETGSDGVQKDIAKSIQYYELAAQAGLPEAQTNLGLIYANGDGVAADPAKAAELWTSASIANNAIAQFNLGLAYLSGSGVETNQDEGLGLVLVAAAQGLPDARFAMAQFYLRGLGLPEDLGLARYFFEEARDAGDPNAQTFIDDLDQSGIASADIDKAVADGRLPSLPKLLSANLNEPQPSPAPRPQPAPQPIPVPEPQVATQPEAQPAAQPEAQASNEPIVQETPQDQDVVLLERPATQVLQEPIARPIPTPVQDPSPEPLAPASPLRVAPEAPATPPASPLRVDRPQTAPQSALPQPTPLPRPQPTQRQPRQPQAAQQGQSGFVESPEGMLVMKSENLPGDVVVLWLGTMHSTAQGKEFWEFSLARAPEILGQVDAILQPIRVKGKRVYRVLAGPLPSEALAWKICNAIKAGAPKFFCKPLVI